jgi:hypothetical protein
MESPSNRLLSYAHLHRFVDRFLPSFQRLGAGAIAFDHIGNRLYSDYGRKGISRHQAAGEIARTLESVGRENEIMLTAAASYALGAVSHSLMAPAGCSQYMISYESVPFYQIALRGIVNISTEAINFSDNPHELMLKCYETGMSPLFRFIGSDTAVLNNSILNELYAASYADWKEDYLTMMREYKTYADRVRGAFIVAHEKIAEGVFITRYDNGAGVIVNYNETDAAHDGLVIPAFGCFLF